MTQNHASNGCLSENLIWVVLCHQQCTQGKIRVITMKSENLIPLASNLILPVRVDKINLQLHVNVARPIGTI